MFASSHKLHPVSSQLTRDEALPPSMKVNSFDVWREHLLMSFHHTSHLPGESDARTLPSNFALCNLFTFGPTFPLTRQPTVIALGMFDCCLIGLIAGLRVARFPDCRTANCRLLFRVSNASVCESNLRLAENAGLTLWLSRCTNLHIMQARRCTSNGIGRQGEHIECQVVGAV